MAEGGGGANRTGPGERVGALVARGGGGTEPGPSCGAGETRP